MELPPPPARTFASDNAAGAHPAVLEAIASANEGHAIAYGDDPWTRRVEGLFRDLFGDVTTLLTFNGTGANILALATLLGPTDAVVCTQESHIAVDEAGASERLLGAKLIDLPSVDGKLHPDQLDEVAQLIGNIHHVQPSVVSVTQCTELGTVYTPDEMAAICDRAHRHGMTVHVDGARLANATVALGGDAAALRSFTVDAGVDVLTFGGTKNGMLGGEAVVHLRPELARRALYLRKQLTQLPSKMRFVAAQFIAMFNDDLWLRLAGHSNSMAQELYGLTAELPAVKHLDPPAVNGLFPILVPEVIQPLRDWSFFWDWDLARDQVRWMTAWDTTSEDVEAFAAGVSAVLD